MPRTTSLLLGVALLAAACSSGESEATAAPSDTTTTTSGPTKTMAATTTTTTLPTYVGADGVRSVIADTSRIISLNGDITEILFELGLGDQVVAIDVTTTFPAQAAALPPVGFAQGLLAAEPVLDFMPTLVIGDIRVGPPEVLTQIRDAGVPVAVIPYETELAGIRTKIENVAQIVGLPDRGVDLVAGVEGGLSSAAILLSTIDPAEAPRVAFLYARGPEALLLFGPGSPSSTLIDAAGAIDAVQGPPFGPLTPEALAAANPDVIITTEGALGALGGTEAFLDLPGVSQTPAGAAARILAYDEALFLGLSPRVGEALTQLIQDLYAEQVAG